MIRRDWWGAALLGAGADHTPWARSERSDRIVDRGELRRRVEELVVSRRPGGRPAANDCCLVQFSSGSTGEPKIVGRTPDSLLEEIDRYARVDGMPATGERV